MIETTQRPPLLNFVSEVRQVEERIFALERSMTKQKSQVASCFHSGDLGDIVYSLACLKNRLQSADLLLGPCSVNTRLRMGYETFRWFSPLLVQQTYIRNVAFCDVVPRGIDYDLNAFRRLWFSPERQRLKVESLFQSYPVVFGFERMAEDQPWLSARPRQMKERPILIHRSPRYWNSNFPWPEVAERYADRLAFIGHEEEFKKWTGLFGPVAIHIPVANAAEMAAWIAGCKLFIGNQSLPMAIALGLGVPVIQETSLLNPDCVLNRSNSQFSCGAEIILPDIP